MANASAAGIRASAGAKAQIAALRTQNTPRPLSMSSQLLSDFVVQSISTDLAPGANLITGASPTPNAATTNGRIIMFPSTQSALGDSGCAYLTVAGEGTYNEIRGGSYEGAMLHPVVYVHRQTRKGSQCSSCRTNAIRRSTRQHHNAASRQRRSARHLKHHVHRRVAHRRSVSGIDLRCPAGAG